MGFNHFDENGNAVMVDVSEKAVTSRTATAKGTIVVSPEVMKAIHEGTAKKGDVLGVARVAGIMAVKKTPEFIPMAHPLPVTKASVDFELDDERHTITAFCTVKTDGKTGVEMEALTGVHVTLLTIYDMCKAMDKRMRMENI
ncbi:MAG: cyclic pyranopterin monophosphate synthase MoaC, partial [Acutalibacteraceae bacterium]|nr:cyclic pyranopterin monophosphate synthase MoaC [Acutalibacteraceae bacterium]